MAVKIRLTRRGSTHHPFYRLVVADSRSRRDGRVVDTLGYYNPLPVPADVQVEGVKTLDWLKKGAQPSDTAKSLLKQIGVWQKFQLLKQGKSEEEAEAEVAKILEIRSTKAARTTEAVKAKQAAAKKSAPPPAEPEPEAAVAEPEAPTAEVEPAAETEAPAAEAEPAAETETTAEAASEPTPGPVAENAEPDKGE
jgi:small subunit ribosomal protein S16